MSDRPGSAKRGQPPNEVGVQDNPEARNHTVSFPCALAVLSRALTARVETPKGVTTAATTGGEGEVRNRSLGLLIVGPMVIGVGMIHTATNSPNGSAPLYSPALLASPWRPVPFSPPDCVVKWSGRTASEPSGGQI